VPSEGFLGRFGKYLVDGMILAEHSQGDHPSWKILEIFLKAIFFDRAFGRVPDEYLKVSHIEQINGARVFMSKVYSNILETIFGR
jgi:hypothetical protein